MAKQTASGEHTAEAVMARALGNCEHDGVLAVENETIVHDQIADLRAAGYNIVPCADKAEALAARLQRIARIVETVLNSRTVAEGIIEVGPAAITIAELSEIYTLATRDRPAANSPENGED